MGESTIDQDRGLRYEELIFESNYATLAAIASGDPEVVARAVLACAVHSDDPVFVETLAVALTVSADPLVRRSAVLALAHLVRRFGRVNRPAVDSLMVRLDSDVELRGSLDDLRDDLEVFGG